MTEGDPDRHLEVPGDLVIGKGTKMCEKCCKLHDGLTCRQFALMQELQGNALVAVGVLAEFIEELVMHLSAGREIQPNSVFAEQAQALLDQVMKGPMFRERQKEKMHASGLAHSIWDEAEKLATFIVPDSFKPPFVAAAAHRLMRAAVEDRKDIKDEVRRQVHEELFKQSEIARYQQSIQKSPDGKQTVVTFAGVVGRKLWSMDNANIGWNITSPEGSIVLEALDRGVAAMLLQYLNTNLLMVDDLHVRLSAAMEKTQAPMRADGDKIQSLVDELERLRQCFIDESAKHSMTGMSLRNATDERNRLADEGEVMTLLDDAIDLTVDFGIHHSGKSHALITTEKVLQSLAAEAIELSAELRNGTNQDKRGELSDVYIAFRHLLKKLEVTRHQLASMGIIKLMTRNSFSNLEHAEKMKRYKKLIDASTNRVSEKGLRG